MSKAKKTYVHLLIAITIFLVLNYGIPAVNGLTASGVRLLALFVPTIYLWLTVGTTWTSLLALLMIASLDIMGMSAVSGASFGGITTMTVVGFVLCSNALNDCGFLGKVAKFIVTRNVVEKRPWVFFLFWSFGIIFVGTWISCLVTLLLFSELAQSICDNIGYKRGDKFYTAMMLVVLWSAGTAEGIFPVGKIVGLTAMGVMSNFGFDLNMVQHLVMSIPYAILFALAIWCVVRFVIKPDCSKFHDYEVATYRKELEGNKLSKKEIICMIAYIFVIIIFILPSLSFLGDVATFFARMGSSYGVLLITALLCIIHVDGEPIIDLNRDLARVPWGIVWFTGCILVFSGAMASPDNGVSAFFGKILGGLFTGNNAALVIVALVLFLTLVMTNFVSNSVTIAVMLAAFMPILINNATSSGVNPTSVASALIMAANIAFLTPAASPIAPLILGSRVDIGKVAKYSGVLLVLSYFIILLVFLIFG